MNLFIVNPDLDESEKLGEIEEIQNESIYSDLGHDSALLVFAAVAKELIMAQESAALITLKSGFDNLFEKNDRKQEETALAILNIVSAIKNDITNPKLFDIIGEAFEVALDSNNFIESDPRSINDLDSEASLEDIREIKFQEFEGLEDEKKESEEPNVSPTQETVETEKKQQEESEAIKNQKQQDENAEEEKKKKKKLDVAKDSSSEKPKEIKSFWQILKDGSQDVSTNKIPRAVGAIILGDFAALSIGGALGGPIGLAVVFLFWQFTKDSKEKDKSADRAQNVNDEVDKYKAEREEIRKEIREKHGAETATGRAASEVEGETLKRMQEQKSELESAKKAAQEVVSQLKDSGIKAEGNHVVGGKNGGSHVNDLDKSKRGGMTI